MIIYYDKEHFDVRTLFVQDLNWAHDVVSHIFSFLLDLKSNIRQVPFLDILSHTEMY